MQQQLLIDGVFAVMKFCEDNRTPDTVSKYRLTCETINKYYAERNLKTYSQSLNRGFQQEIKTRLEGNPTTGFSEDRYLFRMLGMLDDYFAGRPFKDKYPLVRRFKVTLEPFYEEWAVAFKASLNVGNLTIPVLYSIARDFFYYLQTAKITDLNFVSQEIIYDFFKYEYPDHMGCMGNVIYVTRLLCGYLHNEGYDNVPVDLLAFTIPPSRKKVLPSFSRSDLERILEGPDTDDPAGKRDFAILMLASVTGMRAIDIANLKLTDINWKDITLHFIQHKTRFGLSLPLDKEAAAVLADYILNGRPDSELPYVFLTAVMPYRKLSDKSSVANILNKYVKLSRIDKAARDGKSFHAFRRSIGSWMLESGADPEMISQVLGHHSGDVLKRYLPLETEALSICALGFDDMPVRSEVYR